MVAQYHRARSSGKDGELAAANIASEIRGEESSEYYCHELATIIDAGEPDSIYLNFGI